MTLNNILVLPGDNIGPEITSEAVKVINQVKQSFNLDVNVAFGVIGGEAIDNFGHPCPIETINLAKSSKAILLGAVGGPKWDSLENKDRPEAGLLKLRSELDLFCNLRPATVLNGMADTSTLKTKLVDKLSLIESWDDYILENVIKEIIENMNLKFKDLGQPLRLALFGTTNGPSVSKVMKIIGKELTLKKIQINWN